MNDQDDCWGDVLYRIKQEYGEDTATQISELIDEDYYVRDQSVGYEDY